jgi:purine nucleosidase/pyrimidine-specific ribonucleoside hydrolase
MMGKRIILDTDGGVDDALALILALRSPQFRVEAITVTYGNVSVEQASQNIQLLLRILHLEDPPPIALGARHPLKRARISAEHVHGQDGLGGITQWMTKEWYSEFKAPRELPDATQLLLRLAERYPGELTLITLGPLTNLAQMLEKAPSSRNLLKEVVIMGGALEVPGNITAAAEFNIFSDPHAAEQVFHCGLSLRLVPLDATRQVCLDRNTLYRLTRSMPSPLNEFVLHISQSVLDYMERTQGNAVLHLHDPLAVGVTLNPKIAAWKPLHVEVETQGIHTLGMTLADLRPLREELLPPPNLLAARDVDSKRFLRLFEEILCRRSS